jgi:hypothetical protein
VRRSRVAVAIAVLLIAVAILTWIARGLVPSAGVVGTGGDGEDAGAHGAGLEGVGPMPEHGTRPALPGQGPGPGPGTPPGTGVREVVDPIEVRPGATLARMEPATPRPSPGTTSPAPAGAARGEAGASATATGPKPSGGGPSPGGIAAAAQTPITAVVARVRGIVVDEEGGPVAGAKVRLESRGASAPVVLGVVVSGEDGRFENDVPDGARSLDALVDKPGYVPVRATWFPGGLAVIRLPRGRELRGRVVDAGTGHGIRAAVLRIYDPSGQQDAPLFDPAFTSAVGDFTLVVPRERTALRVAAIGYAQRVVEVPADATRPAPFALDPIGRFVTVVGTVRVDGVPAGGAEVRFVPTVLSPVTEPPSTRAGPGGDYRLEGIPWYPNPPANPLFPLRFFLDAGGGRRGNVMEWAPATSERDGEVPLDLAVPASQAKVFEGVVTSEGHGVAGAQLEFLVPENPQAGATLVVAAAATDADGSYRLTLDPARSNGFLRVRTSAGLAVWSTLPPGWQNTSSPIRHDVALPASVPARVLVQASIDGFAHPLAGARVAINSLVLFTGADGVVTLRLPRESASGFHIAVQAAGWLQGLGNDSVSVDPEKGVDAVVTMHPGGRIAGRVVDVERRPVEGVRVQVGRAYAGPTRADGLFDLTTWGTSLHLEAVHPDYETATLDGVKPDSVLPDVVLRRKGAGTPTPPR